MGDEAFSIDVVGDGDVSNVLRRLQPRGGDWVGRLRQLGEGERELVIMRALLRQEVIKCISNAIASPAPRAYLVACLDVLWDALARAVEG